MNKSNLQAEMYAICGKCGECAYCKSVRESLLLIRQNAQLTTELAQARAENERLRKETEAKMTLNTNTDIRTLLNEIERLTGERDAYKAKAEVYEEALRCIKKNTYDWDAIDIFEHAGDALKYAALNAAEGKIDEK